MQEEGDRIEASVFEIAIHPLKLKIQFNFVQPIAEHGGDTPHIYVWSFVYSEMNHRSESLK